MCLVLSKKYRKCVAKSDIICYKHVLKELNTNTLLTTYRKFPVEIGSTYTSNFRILTYTPSLELSDEISEGLHSFKSLNACRVDARLEIRRYSNKEMVICRCVIPKGSEYYVGNFCFETCYASAKITYEEIIETVIL